MNRTGEYGRVRVWDTESWVANTDDRVATVAATWLSASDGTGLRSRSRRYT